MLVTESADDCHYRLRHFRPRASLPLTRKEFDLLAYLASRPGQIIPKPELAAHVWGSYAANDHRIDVHLSWLRRKLGESAAAPRYLHVVKSVGVKLIDPG